jgi:hypothetical protein
MNTVDQNSALISLDEALIPGAALLDGRTEQDWLCFLTDFASLINFYDNDNHINGDWTPFLLKDPVFLLAHISKTRLSQLYTLYLSTCSNLKTKLEQPTEMILNEVGMCFNHLFDQLTHICMLIKRWVYYMQRSDEEYDLKTFVIYQTKNNFSKYFWALISFRQNLFLSKKIPGVRSVQYDRFCFFGPYEELIWKQDKDKTPYWTILGLKHPLTANLNIDFFRALTKAGDNLFNFFHAVINHANADFEKVKAQKSRYPDTTLLRTFVNLLKVQQDQLNEVSQRHLQFYYKDILKQTPLSLSADSVFVCAELAKTDATYNLPAGTLLNAGLTANKTPILFATTEEVTLNPAVITGAATLSVVNGNDNLPMLYYQAIPNPGVIQKDEDGKTKGWNAFGPSALSIVPTIPVTVGTAIASPMLLLKEGKRTITITLTFEDIIADASFLNGATYYLSTAKDWFKVSSQPPGFLHKTVTITIILEATAPAIAAFTTPPEGLNTTWPMFKIEFKSLAGLDALPTLTAIKIDTDVTGLKTFSLNNDYGGLSSKIPFQLFGPMPLVNSTFTIGSTEIFSKPFTSFDLTLLWDTLPNNFGLYYAQYNIYLYPWFAQMPGIQLPPDSTEPGQSEQATPQTEGSGKRRSFLGLRWPLWGKKNKATDPGTNVPVGDNTLNSTSSAYTSSTGPISAQAQSNAKTSCCPAVFPLLGWYPFNNWAFKVRFSIFRNQVLNSIEVACNVPPVNPTTLTTSDTATKQVICGACNLFATNNSFELVPASYFSYHAITDNNIAANDAAAIVDVTAAASAYIQMRLTAPLTYGFGSQVYPKIVANTAFENAKAIYKGGDGIIQPQPNLPFAPKVEDISINYKASQCYTLDHKPGEYPIQCFLCTSLKNAVIYDSNASATIDYSSVIASVAPLASISQTKARPGFKLMPEIANAGFLMLQMDNLVPASSVSMYVEVSRTNTLNTNQDIKLSYLYLSTGGWKPLPVVADGTNNLSCTGIIKLNVPEDIDNKNTLKPAGKFWFCLSVNNNQLPSSQIVFLKLNGIKAQRVVSSSLLNGATPLLAANTITKPQAAIAQISTIVQPFPSFGGAPAESEGMMYRRVSNRIKNKDRAVTSSDYFRLIKQHFNDIFYTKVVFDKYTNITHVYVLKTYDSPAIAGAFSPLVSRCTEDKIQTFLSNRMPGLSNIRVSNFNLIKIEVTAEIGFVAGSESYGVLKNVSDAINIYLSPWISSVGPQIAIGITQITDTEVGQVINLIKSINGVAAVTGVVVQLLLIKNNCSITSTNARPGLIQPGSSILVSAMAHNLIPRETK